MTSSVLRSPGFVAGMVIGLILAMFSAVFLGDSPLLQQAAAQLPDPGAQRNRLYHKLSEIDAKMDVIIKLLKSGQIKTNRPQADNQEAGVISYDALQPQLPDKVPTTATDGKGGNSR